MERQNIDYLLCVGPEEDDQFLNGLVANWNQEDQGSSGSGQESDKQPEEPVPGRESLRASENVSPWLSRWTCTHPVRVLVPECRLSRRYRFTLLQLQGLEDAFQRSHYLTTAETKRLARSIGVSEARVQKWFRKRREQYRNYKRL